MVTCAIKPIAWNGGETQQWGTLWVLLRPDGWHKRLSSVWFEWGIMMSTS